MNYFLVANQQVKLFDGDLDDYQRWLFEQREQKSTPVTKINKRKLLDQIEKLETKLAKLNNDLQKIDVLLADNDLYHGNNTLRLQELLAKKQQLVDSINESEASWLELSQQLEP